MKYRVTNPEGTATWDMEMSAADARAHQDWGYTVAGINTTLPAPPPAPTKHKVTLYGGPLHNTTHYIDSLTKFIDANTELGVLRYERRGEGSLAYVWKEPTPPAPEHGRAIEDATRVMRNQRVKGMHKYGVGIEDCNYEPGELLVGAQEEIADAAVYLAEGIKRFNAVTEALFSDLGELGVAVDWNVTTRRYSVSFDESRVLTRYTDPQCGDCVILRSSDPF